MIQYCLNVTAKKIIKKSNLITPKDEYAVLVQKRLVAETLEAILKFNT